MNVWVLDASVLVKTLVDEDGSEIARNLIGGNDSLLCPALAITEVANAILRKVRRQEISADGAHLALELLDAFPVEFVPLQAFEAPILLKTALAIGATAHDAVYLLLTMSRGAKLVTADTRLVRSAQAHPVWRDRVVALGVSGP